MAEVNEDGYRFPKTGEQINQILDDAQNDHQKVSDLEQEVEGVIYNKQSSVGNDVVLFTDSNVKAGDVVEFALTKTEKDGTGAIGFFLKDGTRHGTRGFSTNVPVGTTEHYTYTIPENFDLAKVIWGGYIDISNIVKSSSIKSQIKEFGNSINEQSNVIKRVASPYNNVMSFYARGKFTKESDTKISYSGGYIYIKSIFSTSNNNIQYNFPAGEFSLSNGELLVAEFNPYSMRVVTKELLNQNMIVLAEYDNIAKLTVHPYIFQSWIKDENVSGEVNILKESVKSITDDISNVKGNIAVKGGNIAYYEKINAAINSDGSLEIQTTNTRFARKYSVENINSLFVSGGIGFSYAYALYDSTTDFDKTHCIFKGDEFGVLVKDKVVIIPSNAKTLIVVGGSDNETASASLVVSIKDAVDNVKEKSDATTSVLDKYLKVIESYAKATKDSIVLKDVKAGDSFYLQFTSLSSSCAVGFFKSDDTRIGYAGLGSADNIGVTFKSKITIPENTDYCKIIWGSAENFIAYTYDLDEISSLNNRIAELEKGDSSIKDYFKAEMEETIKTITSYTKKPAVVLPILTDSHIGTNTRGQEWPYETISNVRYLSEHCYCDGVAHLGDLLNSSWWNILLEQGLSTDDANEVVYLMMQEYLMALSNANKHSFFVNGNHDGIRCQEFMEDGWYGIIGRKMEDDVVLKKDGTKAYFYVDYKKCKTRLVFLSQPDNYSGTSVTFGYSQNQLQWLANDALKVEDGYHVILFSHIPPFLASYVTGGILQNRASFYGLCNAFNNHTTYSDSVVSCDFSNLQVSKIVCELCGHVHGDWIYQPGESFAGTAVSVDSSGNTVSWTYVNEMPCPVVLITNTFVGSGGDGVTRSGDCGVCHVPRKDKTVTQDAWDTMVFRPDLKKIILVRFGSGNDREIDLTSIM